jgi:hypothetical protein
MTTVHREDLNPNARSDRPRVSTAVNRRSHAIHYAWKSRRRRNYLHATRDRSIQGQKVGPMFVQSRHLWHNRRLRSPIVSTDVIKCYTSKSHNSLATQRRVLTQIYDSTNYSGATHIRNAGRAPENEQNTTALNYFFESYVESATPLRTRGLLP